MNLDTLKQELYNKAFPGEYCDANGCIDMVVVSFDTAGKIVDRAYKAGQEDTELAEYREHSHGVECLLCFKLMKEENRGYKAGLTRASEIARKEVKAIQRIAFEQDSELPSDLPELIAAAIESEAKEL